MIRPATPDDLPVLMEWAGKFHAMAGMPFDMDPAAIEGLLLNLMESGCLLIGPKGMIGGLLAPAYANPAWIMAVELFWWAEGGGTALLSAFEAWAAGEGAQEVRMTSLASLPRADGLLKASGYAPAEISYRKVI